MNIFGVGLPEVTVILILALLIFGPKKLPELGKQLGKTLKSLKKASNEFQNEIDQVMNEEDKKESPKSIESNQNNEINQEKIDSENKNFSGHSLRSGFATVAAESGADERSIMAMTGHKTTQMVRRYIKEANIFKNNALNKISNK